MGNFLSINFLVSLIDLLKNAISAILKNGCLFCGKAHAASCGYDKKVLHDTQVIHSVAINEDSRRNIEDTSQFQTQHSPPKDDYLHTKI
jgi:hypothetical protein